MTTKGYHRYRGRNTRGKVALVIVLVLVLIAAVAYLLTQEYVVYDDEGKAHLELPWFRKEPEKPQPDPAPVPDDVDITREEPQRQKVEAIHAWELPYGCLGGDPGYLLTGREAVAVNVKMYDGSVAITRRCPCRRASSPAAMPPAGTSRPFWTATATPWQACLLLRQRLCRRDGDRAARVHRRGRPVPGRLPPAAGWTPPSRRPCGISRTWPRSAPGWALTRSCWIGSCIPPAATRRPWTCLPTGRRC